MPQGMKSERDIRRLFRDHDFVVVRLRHGKHWVVFAHPVGREHDVTRFTLSGSTNDQNLWQIIRGDFRRAAGDRNNEKGDLNMKTNDRNQMSLEDIRARIGELVEMGLVVDSGQRRWSEETGQYEIVWMAKPDLADMN